MFDEEDHFSNIKNVQPVCVPFTYVFIGLRSGIIIVCIQDNSKIRLITSITQITLFSFVLRFGQFCLSFRKLIVDGTSVQRKVK